MSDDEGRRLQVLGENGRSWSAGFSYKLSWDEAMGYALDGVASNVTPNFTVELWDTQYVIPEPGTASVLEVGFFFERFNG